ncbi:phosphomannomutase [Agaribacterium sp. ZY112]|uniref:phosphomannomutase n=1 Tax=Agaribacterium sp. ZY112 TaxID=3233574 RepID=UPI003524E826
MLKSSEVLAQSAVKFGTSGARGLVEDFSVDVCAAFTHAFLASMKASFSFDSVAIAIDNRPSSYAMAQAISAALSQAGIRTLYYGVVPTPALAFIAMQQDLPAIMVTGSHIPFDRNGLKFYRPDGEISKDDEHIIVSAQAEFASLQGQNLAELKLDKAALELYTKRYSDLFAEDFLSGLKIGIYEHSSAGRDIYAKLFSKLGADVVSLGRSDEFVPIDTEAVAQDDILRAKAWSTEYGFDFIFSTDGDGDRPLVADEKGEWLRGDVLGLLCAKALGVEALAVPVSCNTAIEQSAVFKHVERCKIGSPYVIAEFASLNSRYASVAGFEANGGFLLGSNLKLDGKSLDALPTRDAILPALMLLSASIKAGQPISALVAQLPQRFTYSDRIKAFPTELSRSIIEKATADPVWLCQQLNLQSAIRSVDTTDGLRLSFESATVVHFRPSGNAPELRCYAEADTAAEAKTLVDSCLAVLASQAP